MARRDLTWSNAIDRLWGASAEQTHEDRTVLHRIVDWAFQHPAPERMARDTRRLWAVTLTWIFSTSNRLARDWATKALARLLEGSLADAEWLLRHFLTGTGTSRAVKDPYILERLLCGVYGATLRTESTNGLQSMAEAVYDLIFRRRKKYCHVLGRDYARGIIEFALMRGCSFGFDLNRIRPPYNSAIPRPSLPVAELKKRYGLDDEHGSWEDSYRQAWGLIALGRHGSDFAIYQVSPTVSRFENHRAGKVDTLRLYENVPAWMFERMVKLGWHPRFESKEHRVSHQKYFNRHDQAKPETLTKKYAWIALHEAQGMLADCLKVRAGFSHRDRRRYSNGPWEGSHRDIDPTLLLPRELAFREEESRDCWWFPAPKLAPDWRPEVDDETWMRGEVALPDAPAVLEHRLDDGSMWLMLDSFNMLYEPRSPWTPPAVPREMSAYSSAATSFLEGLLKLRIAGCSLRTSSRDGCPNRNRRATCCWVSSPGILR